MKNLLSHRLLLTIYIALCLSNIITAQWIQQQIPANIGILLAIDIMDNSGISGGWAFENIPTGRMIYTTNWIERFNKSCRRTLKIRGAFPNEDSVLALITSVAVDKSEKQYKYPIYNFKFEPKLVENKRSKNNELINLLKTF